MISYKPSERTLEFIEKLENKGFSRVGIQHTDTNGEKNTRLIYRDGSKEVTIINDSDIGIRMIILPPGVDERIIQHNREQYWQLVCGPNKELWDWSLFWKLLSGFKTTVI